MHRGTKTKRKYERGKLRVSESRGKVYFYYAEREQVQAHEVRLKVKTKFQQCIVKG